MFVVSHHIARAIFHLPSLVELVLPLFSIICYSYSPFVRFTLPQNLAIIPDKMSYATEACMVCSFYFPGLQCCFHSLLNTFDLASEAFSDVYIVPFNSVGLTHREHTFIHY